MPFAQIEFILIRGVSVRMCTVRLPFLTNFLHVYDAITAPTNSNEGI